MKKKKPRSNQITLCPQDFWWLLGRECAFEIHSLPESHGYSAGVEWVTIKIIKMSHSANGAHMSGVGRVDR